MLIKPAVQQYINDRPNAPTETEFPTGIPSLDSGTWFSRKNLNIIAGRTSNNKSTFVLNCLAVPTAEAGKKVIIYSLEDRIKRYSERYLANKCNINNLFIKLKRTTVEEDNRLTIRSQQMKELPLDIIEDVGYTIDEIKKDLADRKPDMVIIDYLNKIRIDSQNPRIEINNYVSGFSLLAKQMNFCGVICCQINRSAMKDADNEEVSKPMLHHLKESGNLEEQADLAILLHWDYFYTRNPSQKNNIKIIVAKNKDGDVGELDVHIEPQYNRIDDLVPVPSEGPIQDAFAERMI
jgi:replicative DNA helicase